MKHMITVAAFFVSGPALAASPQSCAAQTCGSALKRAPWFNRDNALDYMRKYTSRRGPNRR